MKVVAISGWKRSGKDTAANYLIDTGYERVAFADPLKDMVAREYNIPRAHCDDPKFKEQPIMHLPVTPKDDFTLNIAKMMFKEFRTEEGYAVPEYFVDASGAFIGLLPGKGVFTDAVRPVQLYWTPRALCILKGSTNRAVNTEYWVELAITEMAVKDKLYKVDGKDYKVVISDLRYRSEVAQLKQAFGSNLVTVRVNRFDDCQSTDASERDLDNAQFDVVIENRGTLEEFIGAVKGLLT